MKKKLFLLGLLSRIVIITISAYILGISELRYNDMSEIIYLGMNNMFFNQTNPYSVQYVLHWGITTFQQPLNYGPVTLIAFAPAMLLSNWIGSWWPGMTLMSTIYDFLFCETIIRLSKKETRLQNHATMDSSKFSSNQNHFLELSGAYLWMIPFGVASITQLLPFPILMMALAFTYRDNPKLLGLFLSLGCLSYQLCFLFVPFYVAYTWKSNLTDNFVLKKIFQDKEFLKRILRVILNFVIGCIPVIIIFGGFLLWGDPMYIIESLFMWTSKMGYIKADGAAVQGDEMVWSIPKWLFNLSDGEIQIGNQARLVMFAILGTITLFYLFSSKWKDNILVYCGYSIIAVLAFILTTNYGGLHYIYFALLPTFVLIQYKKPDFHKKYLFKKYGAEGNLPENLVSPKIMNK